VAAAGDERRVALANNRYSADVVAIAHAESLTEVPDLPGDNALPRWLEEVAGYEVSDLRRRWRLAVDIDGPLELVLLGDRGPADVDLRLLETRLAQMRGVAADRRAELVVSGRTSPATLKWLEKAAAARVRAFVEERGLRAASRLAQEEMPSSGTRPPASLLGALLDRDGPGSLGEHLTRLGDAAIVDSRVLLAHRLGPDETTWPAPEDRFASDLLLSDRIADPWLRDLTASAVASRIPILLGGHSLVGPGVRLLLGPPRRWRWT
jgi:DNA-binding transcriptional ArsR family regulator